MIKQTLTIVTMGLAALFFGTATANAEIERVETGVVSGQGTVKTVEFRGSQGIERSSVQGTVKEIEYRTTEFKPAITGELTESVAYAPIPQSNSANANYWERVDGKTPVPESIQIGLGWIDDPLAE